MGTAYNPNADQESIGIIPRAVADIFAGIEQRASSSFIVKVSFIEVRLSYCFYNHLFVFWRYKIVTLLSHTAL